MDDQQQKETVGSRAPFSVLCTVLDQISSSPNAEKRRQRLKRFIDNWRDQHRALHGDAQTIDSFYPAMRLILPGYDKERGPYGFKENLLAKKLIDILMMDKHGADAQRLLNYRAPQHARAPSTLGDSTGDFAAAASEVLKHRVSKSANNELTLEEVNDRLDAIADANASNNKTAMNEQLEQLCRKVDALELKWLIRILLKQMKIGMQENSVLNMFHSEAPQLYDVTTSLQRVCQQLQDPNTRLDVIQVQVFTPFRPMLANRTSSEKVEEIMGNQPFYIEEKYDGERFQLHKRGDEYRYFSRNANDYTSSYGASSKDGSFTPYIHKAFKSSVKTCILDGEMVGWNPDGKCVATKGEQFDVKALKDGDDIQPCFVVFDCLLINDEVLTLKPLEERVQRMRECFAEIEGRYMYARQELKNNEQDVIDAINWAIERREEGIIIKRPDSKYKLNVRSNEGGWLKIKPDYEDAICDDLDLLIMGGYFGEGGRSKLMSHFMLGLAIPGENPGDKPKKFVSVAKVGTGYTMKELYDLNVYLTQKPLRKVTAMSAIPEWYSISSERPDVFIDPQHSKIVQVRAAEINLSRRFYSGYTLRFPRVQKIRNDKDWYECMSLDDFHRLRVESEGRLAQKLRVKDETSPSKKRRIGTAHLRLPKPTLGSQFRGADVKNVKKTSDIFKDKEFCVFGGSGPYAKQDLERKIAEFGGKIAQHPGSSTFCVVAEKKIIKVQNIIDGKLTNVVKSSWLVECIDQNSFIPWKPSDLWYATPAVELEFKRDFDQYGDSYTQPVTVTSLRSILERIKPKMDEQHAKERDELMAEYLSDYEYGLFHRCRAYFDRTHVLGDGDTKILNSPLDITSAEYRLYGGSISDSLDDCTHIVMHSKNLLHLPQFNDVNRTRARKFHLVTEAWINGCIREKALLEEVDFQPVIPE